MTYTIQIKVMPLKELLDPQGKAVKGGLENLGLSGVELRAQPVEAFLGVPAELVGSRKGEDKAASAARVEKLREWVERRYDPEALMAAYEADPVASFVVDRVLRRE